MKHFIPIVILALGALALSSCASSDPTHTVQYHELTRTFTCHINPFVSMTGEYPTLSAAEAEATLLATKLKLQVDQIKCEEL